MQKRLAFSMMTLWACAPDSSSTIGASTQSSPHSKSIEEAVVLEDDAGNEQAVSPDSLLAPATEHVCNDDGGIHCHAIARRNRGGDRFISPNVVSGFGPADFKAAYAIPDAAGAPLVAIVDAMDNPTAESDLAVYRKQFGLPACTTANGCFKKVNQRGETTNLPAADAGWAGEIALDLDMVSGACPNCKILLVEADEASMEALGEAVNTAARLGAVSISNSYGGGEDASDTDADEQYFKHPGITITVSAGDSGYGAQYPAASPYVTAVGGTALKKGGSGRGWTESVWGSSSNFNGGTGSGCSAFSGKPSWQTDNKCANRTVADVSAVADPSTGVAVYDSNSGGWAVYGGTSASSPLIAAIWAAVGIAGADASFAYANPTAFNDVISGTNGSCSNTYLCKAGNGYDGPTGVGTPNGQAIAGIGAPTTPPDQPPSNPSTSQEQEPNDSISHSSNSLESGASLAGSIDGSDVDYFRIAVTKGDTIQLSLATTADCDLRLYNSRGSLVAISDNPNDETESINYRATATVYYAKVYGYDPACTYTLSFAE